MPEHSSRTQRYQIQRQLGAGGMGIVYLAEDTRLQRKVAIKKLRRDTLSDSAHSRIRREAQLLAQLSHPNVVHLYDQLEEEDGTALVMEYVSGPTLSRWMREHSEAPLKQKLQLLVGICHGLSAAHNLGIVHRDLKPDNVLIDDSDGDTPTAKITDFGIARSLRPGDTVTYDNLVTGSSGTMSPEQLLGRPPEPRSDLFALGTLAYRLLCGQSPFGRSESPYNTAERIVRRPHPPAARTNPGLPRPLCLLLDQLLEKKPDRRPVSAAAVAAELETLSGLLDSASTPPPANRRQAPVDTERFHCKVPPHHRRYLLFTTALFATVLAGLALATALLLRTPQNAENRYIALIDPEENIPEESDKRLLLRSALNAIQRELSNRRGLFLVPYSETLSQSGRSAAEQARALNAQLLLKPHFNCKTTCELSLELINTEQMSIVATHRLTLPSNDLLLTSGRLALQLMLPQYPPRDENSDLGISKEDYRHFLQLQEHSFDHRTIEVTAETLDALEALQQRNPSFAPVYELYARIAFDNRFTNRDMDSLDRLEALLSRAPAELAGSSALLEAKYFLANARYQWPKAEKMLTGLKVSMRDPARYYYMAAIHHHMRGNYQQALNAADRALALRKSSTYLMQKALSLTYSGDMQAARPYLQQVLALDSTYLDATALLAANELDMGNLNEAIRLIDTIAPDRRSAMDIFNLCTAHFLQKNLDKADRCFGDLYTSLPQDLEPLLYRAEIARERQQPQRAREFAEEVVKLGRERQGWENKLILARAYAQLQQPQQAVQTLLEIGPRATDDIYVTHALAQAYIATDDLISAETYIRTALQMGHSPLWYQTLHFSRICTDEGFANLRREYPQLCPTQVARGTSEIVPSPQKR